MPELASVITVLERDPDTPSFEQHTIRGLPVLVHNARSDVATPEALDRLRQALELIEQHVPATFARCAEDFTAILVRRYPCRAAFYPDLGVCLIELTFLVHPDITAAQVGASIVHEAMHAHLRHEGAREDSSAAAAREERLCRQAEIEFGLLVPNGEAVVERARAALQMADEEVAPAIDWQLAAARVAAVDARSRPS